MTSLPHQEDELRILLDQLQYVEAEIEYVVINTEQTILANQNASQVHLLCISIEMLNIFWVFIVELSISVMDNTVNYKSYVAEKFHSSLDFIVL